MSVPTEAERREAVAISWALIGQHFMALGEVLTMARKLAPAREALALAHSYLSEVDAGSNHGSIERCPCATAEAFRASRTSVRVEHVAH